MSSFWVEAISAAVYLINLLPSPILNIYHHLKNYFIAVLLNLHSMSLASMFFVHLPSNERSKLSSQAAICVFVGYGLLQNDSYVIILNFFVGTSKIVVLLEHISYLNSVAKITATACSILHAFDVPQSSGQSLSPLFFLKHTLFDWLLSKLCSSIIDEANSPKAKATTIDHISTG